MQQTVAVKLDPNFEVTAGHSQALYCAWSVNCSIKHNHKRVTYLLQPINQLQIYTAPYVESESEALCGDD